MSVLIRSFEENGQQLTLRDLGTHVELLIGQTPILSSAALGTEEAFGALARELSPRPDPRVLLGGLGFGATLSAALSSLSLGSKVLVAEKLATVIELVRGPLARFAPNVLADPRVTLTQEDVRGALARERDLDAIMIDVDNGPDWASFRTNAALYTPAALRTAYEALVPGGAYALWSGYPADAFLQSLRKAGFVPSVVWLRERSKVRARAYIGRRPP